MKYRKANIEDLDNIMTIIEDGRLFLKPQQSGQWQDGYPNIDNIKDDISKGYLYAILTEDDDIASIAAFTYHEEDYDHLYEGHWISEYPYMVMHRISVKEKYRHQGYGDALFKLFELVAKEEGYHSIRIDTHQNNKVMLHLLEKNHFILCGKAILKPNKDRLVFEKII